MAISQATFFEKIDNLIRSEGFAYICIGPDARTPSYAYTVGITETYGCPEFLIFGAGQQIADVVFHTLVKRIKAGTRLADGDLIVEVLNVPCAIKEISDDASRPFALNVWTRYSDSTYAPSFQQIVYPDQAGVFPWEPGYDDGMRRVQLELWSPTVH